MRSILITALFILPNASLLAEEKAVPNGSELIIWNVGQGEWVTWKTSTTCEHFDMGGEHAPWKKIISACGDRINVAHFSHWDLDHLSFALKASQRLHRFCVAHLPAGTGNRHKHKLIDPLITCKQQELINARYLRELATLKRDAGRTSQSQREPTSNDVSRVFKLCVGAIIPGDSTLKAERTWSPASGHSHLPLLILGHHGSRTSTSDNLLQNNPSFRMGVASAREKKYGHPHKEVVARLRQHGIALVRTELWGSLHFYLPARCAPP